VDETTNIWGAKWSKLAVNSMTSGLSAILGVRGWELTQKPELVSISVGLGKETIQVGVALGYNLEPVFGMTAEDFLGTTDEVLKKCLDKLVSHIGKEARSMVFQDLLKKRHTEIDYINGLVVRKGQEAKVPTPLNATVASVIKEIESGKLQQGLSNFSKFPIKQ